MTEYKVEIAEGVTLGDTANVQTIKMEGDSFERDGEIALEPFNLDVTRAQYAKYFLYYVFVSSAAIVFAVIFHALSISEAKELAAIVFTPMIGILGTVMGFYFANKN